MHENLSPWSRFVDRQAEAPPLHFVHGSRAFPVTRVLCPMHEHDSIEIVYHPSGRGVTRLGAGGAVEFAEGSVVVYAPGERHDQMLEEKGEDICIKIAAPARRALPRRGFHLHGVKEPLIIDDLCHLARDRVRPAAAEQALLNLRSTCALYALVHLARVRREEDTGSSANKYVLQAARYIREHFGTLRTLEEVSGHVGISADHLRHAFKAQEGRSLVAYLNEVRMERARTLLIHSTLPLKQIATRCGFADEYYFSAVFRRHTGLPPGRYRRRSG